MPREVLRNRLAYNYDGEIVKEHCQTIVNVYLDKLEEFQAWVEGLDDNGEESGVERK